MDKYEAVKKNDDEILKNDWREDDWLPERFTKHRLAFLKLIEEFESKWVGNLVFFISAKHRIDSLHDDIKPVHSAPSGR